MGGIRLAVAVSVMMLSSLSSGLRAQLGPMEVLPEWGQAGWSNPAILHPSGSHILIGGVSGFQLEVDHSGPHYADFISADGLVDPMALLERMDPVETVGVRSEVPLISLGFREKERFEFRLRSNNSLMTGICSISHGGAMAIRTTSAAPFPFRNSDCIPKRIWITA